MPVRLLPDTKQNVVHKLLYHSGRKVAEGELKISVFSDKEPASFKLWESMFNATVEYVIKFPLIPVASDYVPEQYDEFINRLYDFIRGFYHTRPHLGSIHFGIIDFGQKENPKLHLVVTNRILKNEEFGKWLALGVGCKHVLTRMDLKDREQRDKSQTTVEVPTAAGPQGSRPSSSGTSGQVPEGQTGQETVPSDKEMRIVQESVSTVSSSTEERPGSSMTGYMADFSGESTTEATPTEPQLEQVPGPNILSFAIRRRVFEALGEKVKPVVEETLDSPGSSCGGCLGKCFPGII